jgi:hypothetical protein
LIEDSTVWKSRSWHLGLRLQGGLLLAPIYHSMEFGAIWRSPSARPKHWVFTAIEENVSAARGVWTYPWILFVLYIQPWGLASSCREHFVAAHILSIGAI